MNLKKLFLILSGLIIIVGLFITLLSKEYILLIMNMLSFLLILKVKLTQLKR